MIEFSCADFTFPLLSHEKCLTLIAMMEFSWVDIGLFNDRSHIQPKDQFIEPEKNGKRLRKLSEELGLKISDIFIQTALDFSECAINHPNPIIRKEQREIFKRAMEFTKAAESVHFTGLPGVNFNTVDSKDICFKELTWRLETANKYGIKYSVEPHIGSIMSTPEKALSILKMVPGLTITLDHSHYIAQGIELDRIQSMIPYASHVHARGAAINEVQTSVARSEIDFKEVIKKLKETSYSGKICMEYCYIEWGNCNRTDNISETLIMRELLKKYLQTNCNP